MNAAAGPDEKNAFARAIAAVMRWALARKLVRTVLLYVERQGPMLADSITYRTLFSVFAAVLLGFSIASIWLAGNDVAWNAIISAVNAAVPGLFGADGVIDPDELRDASIGFSLTGIVSLIALIGAALGAIGSLRTAIRALAGTLDDDVLWVWVILRNITLAVGIAAAFVAAAFLTFSGRLGVNWVAGFLGIDEGSDAARWGVRLVSLAVILLLDVGIIAGVFLVLSGVRPSARSLWRGALLGGVGILVLQELSGLFVGGAASNPLLASFASLLALLIWFNLSAQVTLIACAHVITGMEEERDRVHARYGAQTLAQRGVQQAERAVATATEKLRAARDAERAERTGKQAATDSGSGDHA
ncbi:YihY/virulence factor BrkB family protein [Microbacterium aurantiacum]|uniref:YihY/virulence factor BrkB family protein n=1 Tax=Microbacterium aurantiacum TaxID=162393 RepID=UPI000C7FBAF1|nr:YihY/virulence factor BrkB family protein [Microbacterium aurantiacum]